MTRRVLALVALAVLVVVFQSACAAVLPAAAVPDLGLLFAIAAGVLAPTLAGLFGTAAAGYTADLLSGALLGHHALLRLGVFGFTCAVSAQFHLRRGFPLAAFAAALTLADAAGSVALHWLFHRELLLGPEAAQALLLRTALNAAFAPAVRGLLAWVLELLTEREARRRDVRLETRRPVL